MNFKSHDLKRCFKELIFLIKVYIIEYTYTIANFKPEHFEGQMYCQLKLFGLIIKSKFYCRYIYWYTHQVY